MAAELFGAAEPSEAIEWAGNRPKGMTIDHLSTLIRGLAALDEFHSSAAPAAVAMARERQLPPLPPR